MVARWTLLVERRPFSLLMMRRMLCVWRWATVAIVLRAETVPTGTSTVLPINHGGRRSRTGRSTRTGRGVGSIVVSRLTVIGAVMLLMVRCSIVARSRPVLVMRMLLWRWLILRRMVACNLVVVLLLLLLRLVVLLLLLLAMMMMMRTRTGR